MSQTDWSETHWSEPPSVPTHADAVDRDGHTGHEPPISSWGNPCEDSQHYSVASLTHGGLVVSPAPVDGEDAMQLGSSCSGTSPKRGGEGQPEDQGTNSYTHVSTTEIITMTITAHHISHTIEPIH